MTAKKPSSKEVPPKEVLDKIISAMGLPEHPESGPGPFADNAQKTMHPEEDRWYEDIIARLSGADQHPLQVAEEALKSRPSNGTVLMLAAWAAIVEEKPDVCLRYLKRHKKWYFPMEDSYLCQAVAFSQQGRWPQAKHLVSTYNLDACATYEFPMGINVRWAKQWLRKARNWDPAKDAKKKKREKNAASQRPETLHVPAPSSPKDPVQSATSTSIDPLPRHSPHVKISFRMPQPDQYDQILGAETSRPQEFLMRRDYQSMSLLQGFDELLCLPHLHGVEHYWYQVETVRKVLKTFRGRVLLADEVGLGKTIEAGMVLKEYILRGMANRVLILTPPSLVGQWQEEMSTKFEIDFVTSHDPLVRRDPEAFWSQPRIIASIAAARRDVHRNHLVEQPFDLVIVDEAHHLKNRTSKNWKLVDALVKRFLVLLSATPVQNNLVELYNLLTLLKPGMFKTEKDFRSSYVQKGSTRIPTNQAKLHDLMRDVMVRNTRSLVDVRLPPRQALTIRVHPSPEERSCYDELTRLIRELWKDGANQHRLALGHLLERAGSSSTAAAISLERFVRHDVPAGWRQLHDRYREVKEISKANALLDLLTKNPGEKKMVFVRFRETLDLLAGILADKGIVYTSFDGRMTGPEKDQAIEQFRKNSRVLLCSETGGEGRNVQFCNTLINFDLPWNPLAIEQRIGRIHRIGQTREVFIFNLALTGTVEDKILTILEEKINMFELVVGEVQAILGDVQEQHDFSRLVFEAWTEETESQAATKFDQIGEHLQRAKQDFNKAQVYDDELFGENLEVG